MLTYQAATSTDDNFNYDPVFISNLKQTISNSIQQTNNKVSLKEVSSAIVGLSVSPSSSPSALSYNQNNIELFNELSSDIIHNIQFLVDNKINNEQLIISGASLNTTMIILQNNIRDIIYANYIKFIDKYGDASITTTGGSSLVSSTDSSSVNDDIIKAVSYRIRLELSTILLPLYSSSVNDLIQTQQENFNKQMIRIPATVELPKQLELLSKKTIKIFNSNLDLLRTGMYEFYHSHCYHNHYHCYHHHYHCHHHHYHCYHHHYHCYHHHYHCHHHHYHCHHPHYHCHHTHYHCHHHHYTVIITIITVIITIITVIIPIITVIITIITVIIPIITVIITIITVIITIITIIIILLFILLTF